MGEYEVAQICTQGHILTTIERYGAGSDFCCKCGSRTLTECEKCSAKIRGYYNVPGFIGSTDIDLPQFCHNCGEGYPWYEEVVRAALEAFAEAFPESLIDERQEFDRNVRDMLKACPRQEVAASKVAKAIKGVSNDAFKAILWNLCTIPVQRALGW